MVKYIYMACIFLFTCKISAYGQSKSYFSDSLKTTEEEAFLRDKSFIALPVAFRFPETGWGGGLASTAAWSFAQDSAWAKPSQASFGVTFTQKKQILVFFPFSVFTKNNRFFFNGDTGWYRYNYYYYGIGENRVPEEIYDTDFLRLRLLAAKQINAKTYLGLRLNFESFDVTNTVEGGELASGLVLGSDFSRTSALGIAMLRDTRDQVFYPKKGVFGELNFMPSSKIFGANVTFLQVNLDVSQYQSIGKRLVLASNVFAVNTIGQGVPFSQLAQLGGPKRMRGLYFGYFRDKNALLFQEELRWEVWKRLGFVGFANMGFLGNDTQFLRLHLPKFTYGAGLRIATKNHLNLRLDYGLSPYGSGNFYATIGEAF